MSNDTRTDPPRPGTVHPRLARERALKVLFQCDVRGTDPHVLLDRLEADPAALALLDELEPDEDQVAEDAELRTELSRRSRIALDDYTRRLVGGVTTRRTAIDALLGDVAERWTVTRMPLVDRNLLRMAVYELVEEDTPDPIVIDEALALAAAFAGPKAGPFVNGVLETIRQSAERGEVELRLDPVAVEPDPEPADVELVAVADPAADPGNEAAWGEALDLLDDEPADPDAAEDDEDDTVVDDLTRARKAGWLRGPRHLQAVPDVPDDDEPDDADDDLDDVDADEPATAEVDTAVAPAADEDSEGAAATEPEPVRLVGLDPMGDMAALLGELDETGEPVDTEADEDDAADELTLFDDHPDDFAT